jgi:tetratricopeptide (TPR) repeat protein
VRFAALFSARGSTDETRKLCWQLLELYDESESLSGRAPFGMPPLDDARQALLREDVFEALLIAAQVETDLPAGSDDAQTASAVTRAIEWLDRAKKVLPTTRVLYQRRGEYHRRLGHDELAQHELQRAAETPVTSAVDLFWQGYDEHLLASAAARLGRLPEKQTHLAKALAAHGALLRIRPDHFWGYFGWATSQVAMADPVSLANAVVGFTACIHLQPELPWPYYNRGTVHLNLKQLDEAIKDFDTALALDATYAEAYLNRGLAHREAGRADEAWQDIGQAIAIRPNYALAYSHRGETHRIPRGIPMP